MRRHKITIALVTLLASAPAWSSGDGDLWILPVAVACVAQYPELSSTQLGTVLQQAPQLAPQISAAKAAFASHPWQGKALCDELMHEDLTRQPEDKGHFDKMREKHIDAFRSLVEQFPQLWAAPEAAR
jgi:hypothetical protein